MGLGGGGVKTRTAHTPRRRRLGFLPDLGAGAYIIVILLFYRGMVKNAFFQNIKYTVVKSELYIYD